MTKAKYNNLIDKFNRLKTYNNDHDEWKKNMSFSKKSFLRWASKKYK